MNTELAESKERRPRTKEIIDPSYPLLEANREAIESIQSRTFVYGSTDVHKLDVYYPQSRVDAPDSTENFPVLVFFYGGSLVRGARSSPPSNLVYNNLGAFFASRGIITVIPDYRLVPSITFPQGSEDVRDAIKWIRQQICGDHGRLFVLGHSAGGIHLSGLLLTPSLFSEVEHALCGVILLGVPFNISSARREFFAIASTYYGGAKGVGRHQPIALLKSSEDAYIGRLPPVRSLRAASEPRPISLAVQEFTKLFKAKGGDIQEAVLEHHDHMSPLLALSSGFGEEWAEEVIEWMGERYKGDTPGIASAGGVSVI